MPLLCFLPLGFQFCCPVLGQLYRECEESYRWLSFHASPVYETSANPRRITSQSSHSHDIIISKVVLKHSIEATFCRPCNHMLLSFQEISAFCNQSISTIIIIAIHLLYVHSSREINYARSLLPFLAICERWAGSFRCQPGNYNNN